MDSHAGRTTWAEAIRDVTADGRLLGKPQQRKDRVEKGLLERTDMPERKADDNSRKVRQLLCLLEAKNRMQKDQKRRENWERVKWGEEGEAGRDEIAKDGEGIRIVFQIVLAAYRQGRF